MDDNNNNPQNEGAEYDSDADMNDSTNENKRKTSPSLLGIGLAVLLATISDGRNARRVLRPEARRRNQAVPASPCWRARSRNRRGRH